MVIPRGFKHFAGKENLMASFNNYLMETISGGYLGNIPLPSDKDFFWAFDFPIQPQPTPAIQITERGLFNLGEQSFDRLLGFRNGEPIYGRTNQTLIEVTCIDQDTATKTDSTLVVRNLRDRVIAALDQEAIPLRDYANNPNNPPRIGTIFLDPDANAINEKFIVEQDPQQIKRYVLVFRVFWCELVHVSYTQTITSDADIT